MVPFLFAFTLGTLHPDTRRVRWETGYQGAAYTTPVPLSTAFAHSFVANGYSDVGGFSYWRGDAITCRAAIAGANDGGSSPGFNSILVEVYHEDGGVDCQAELGFGCNSTAENQGGCVGGAFQMNPGSTYYTRLSASSGCQVQPAQFRCVMDLFR